MKLLATLAVIFLLALLPASGGLCDSDLGKPNQYALVTTDLNTALDSIPDGAMVFIWHENAFKLIVFSDQEFLYIDGMEGLPEQTICIVSDTSFLIVW